MSDLRRRLEAQVDADSAAELGRVLDAVRDAAAAILGEVLVGAYLTGSFALGCGDEASDVDLLVVTDRAPSSDDRVAIDRLHASILERPERWAQHVEGSWVVASALRDPVGGHGPWLYVDRGSPATEPSHHDDTWNTRATLRAAGIPLVGPPPATLVPPVARSAMRQEAVREMEAKARWIAEQPEATLDGWAQPYVVLTCCRLLWSSTFGTVAGKAEAARWAVREVVPQELRHLVVASIGFRAHPFDADANRADPALAPATEALVRWAEAEVRRRASSDRGSGAA